MNDSAWLLQIYEMADTAAQDEVASLMSGIGTLVVDKRTCERGSFLIVELTDPTEALALYEMVMMADPHAELIYTTADQNDASAADLAGRAARVADSSAGAALGPHANEKRPLTLEDAGRRFRRSGAVSST
jgi:hypothetical protein